MFALYNTYTLKIYRAVITTLGHEGAYVRLMIRLHSNSHKDIWRHGQFLTKILMLICPFKTFFYVYNKKLCKTLFLLDELFRHNYFDFTVNVSFKAQLILPRIEKYSQWMELNFCILKRIIFVDLKINKIFTQDLSDLFSTWCPNKALNNNNGC